MINIKESNKGKFTEQANDAGMGVQEFVRHVLANKDDYNSTTIKRANFARNSSKWIHKAQEGRKVDSHYQYELFNRIYPDSIKSYDEYMDKIGNVDNILKNNQKKCNDYKLIRNFIEENNNIKYSDIFPYDVRNIDDDINKYTKVYGLIIPYDMSFDEFKQIINNYMSNNFPLDIKHNGGLIKKIKI